MHLEKTFIRFFLAIAVSAQALPAGADETSTGSRSVFALPVAFYTSDTGFGYGAMGLVGYRGEDTKTSQAMFSIIHTNRNQFDVFSAWIHNFPGNRGRLALEADYSRFPQYHYGSGNATSNADPVLFTPETVKIDLSFERNLLGGLKGKVGGFFRNRSIPKRSGSEEFLSSGVPWAAGRSDAGPRFGFLYDSRDNLTAPLSGTFAQVMYEGSWFHNEGGVFSTFTSEIRNYREILSGATLASMFLLMDTRGDAPFYFLPFLGGQNRLRGYEFGRYTGRSLVLAQEDLRFPIWKRLGGCAFIGAGRVADHVAELSGPEWHFGGGAGLRFFINRADGMVLRFDTAFGNGIQGTYINFGEAF